MSGTDTPFSTLPEATGAAAAAPVASGFAPASKPAAVADHVAVLVLAELPTRHWLWGWSRIVRRDAPWRQTPGLRFAKTLGSGHEGGFGLRPSGSRQGVFLLFDDHASAVACVRTSPVLAAYRQRARELLIVTLRATSSRGSWAGQGMAVTAEATAQMPVASLTRASIRPLKALDFWRHSPAAEASLAQAAGCSLAVGLGEAPLLRQATFSLWDNQAAMDAYARGGAHQDAIRGALRGTWFSESMFVRFVPVQVQGCWKDRVYG